MGTVEVIKGYAVAYVPKLALAIIVLIVGFWLVKKLANFMDRRFEKQGMDVSLRPFIKSLITIGLKVMVVISVASMVGIATTSFIAVLGAAGLAIGLALQGSLANFAGGALILIFKPFKVGDVLEAQGHIGGVKEIQIFNTILTTPDNKTVIMPNGPLSNGSMVNYSTEPLRRVDLTFGIGYSDDIDKARGIIEQILTADERVLKDPKLFIAVSELADSSVNFTVRPWAKQADFWGVFFDTQEKVKKAFDEAGVSIPFPQMDVHQAG